MSDRRYLVADGDGRDYDLADSRRDSDETRLGDAAIFRHRAGSRAQRWDTMQAERRRLPHYQKAVAFDAAWNLQGSRTLRDTIFFGIFRHLFHWRWSAAR